MVAHWPFHIRDTAAAWHAGQTRTAGTFLFSHAARFDACAISKRKRFSREVLPSGGTLPNKAL